MKNWFLIYKYTNVANENIESVYGYVDQQENGDFVCSLTGNSLDWLKDHVKDSYSYAAEGSTVETYLIEENEWYQRKYNVEQPTEITKERFWWLLECLPPEKWVNISRYEIFRVMECVAGNLYTFCIFDKHKNKYFEVVADRSIPYDTLFSKC